MKKKEENESELDEHGRPRTLPPEKVDQTLEGERLMKLEQERIQRAKEEKIRNPEGIPQTENQTQKETSKKG
jgi:hypothetical protein